MLQQIGLTPKSLFKNILKVYFFILCIVVYIDVFMILNKKDIKEVIITAEGIENS